jgi:hypothetical protein
MEAWNINKGEYLCRWQQTQIVGMKKSPQERQHFVSGGITEPLVLDSYGLSNTTSTEWSTFRGAVSRRVSAVASLPVAALKLVRESEVM